MSGFTQTTNELLYAYYGAGTVSTPTTTPGSSMTLGYPPVIVPGGYMSNVGEHSSSLYMHMKGLLIATATIPTFQFNLYATTAQPAAWAATTLIGQTTTATPSATTGQWCTVEWNIGLRTLGLGAASTVTCNGLVTCASLPSPFYLEIPNGASTYTPTCTTWPMDQQVYLWPTLSLGTATAGNTFTCEYLKLYGEN